MKRKNIILLSVCVAVLFLTELVSGVSARYKRDLDQDIENTLIPDKSVQPKIKETFDNTEKKDVYFEVGETGYPVYVRAAIIITWKYKDNENAALQGLGLEEGDISFTAPKRLDEGKNDKDADYLLVLNETDWEKGEDGFYYYNQPVESNGKTTNLIQSCKQVNKDNAPESFILDVEVIVQTVQAVGTTDDEKRLSYQDAWNIQKTFPAPSGGTNTPEGSTEAENTEEAQP